MANRKRTMSNTKLKPLYLYDIFREKTDEGHRLSVPELINLLAERGVMAERKGVYRDIRALVEYGADIVKTRTGYYLRKRDFEMAELKLLISAVQAASFISEARTEALIQKLAGILSETQAQVLLRGSNIGGIKCKNDEIFRTIEMINLGIGMHRQITFSYHKRDINKRSVVRRGGERYRVSPYAMVWVRDKLYLVSNMEGRDDLTHFRLDRMGNVRVDVLSWRHFSQVSEYKQQFLAGDYAKKCLNMYGGEPARITLRCANAIVGEIFDRFGDDIPVMRDGGEHFLIVVEAVPATGFLAWAAQFGSLVEIISPESLRKEMKDMLLLAAKNYETQS